MIAFPIPGCVDEITTKPACSHDHDHRGILKNHNSHSERIHRCQQHEDSPTANIMMLKTGSCKRIALSLLVLLVSESVPSLVNSLAAPNSVPNKGSAARPLDKKNVAVVGAGGSMGALTFGFLQRANSLYGTGVGGYRAICACSDTSTRLNSFLSKLFSLAFANEVNIKLTDLTSVDAIQSRLRGWDALILGSDMAIQRRTVTFGTYERSPNDKCNEIYWKGPSTLVRLEDESAIAESIIGNVLQAAKGAGVKHIVFVDESCESTFQEQLEKTGIPFTRIKPAGELVTLPAYTYQKGIQGVLAVSSQGKEDVPSSSYEGRCYEEDVAALCVQCLLTLDWSKSRSITVSTTGPTMPSVRSMNPKQRPDQEWCVNSFLLQQALAGID